MSCHRRAIVGSGAAAGGCRQEQRLRNRPKTGFAGRVLFAVNRPPGRRAGENQAACRSRRCRSDHARRLSHDSARRRRGLGAHCPGVPARARRLHRHPGGRRRRGAPALRRDPDRPRRARHHAAEARRPRGLQAPPDDEQRPDHHVDGARRRARQGDRPGARCRRLHHEAVLDPRVPLARAGAAAPGAQPAGARYGRADRARGPGDRRRAAHGRGARRAGAADVRRVRAAARRSRPRRAASSAAGCCSKGSGRAPITGIRGRSTSTSGISARSSRQSRARPSTS